MPDEEEHRRSVLEGARIDARRRRAGRARRAAAIGTVSCLVLGGAAILYGRGAAPDRFRDVARGSGLGRQTASSPPADVSTALWFGTERHRGGGRGSVSWLLLLALNRATERAAAVYIPAHTAVEIPGRGLLALGDAFVSGGASLLQMSVENLLGVHLDGNVAVNERAANALFESLGPLKVDVPGEVRRAGAEGELLFSPGTQRLGARWLSRLIFTSGAGGDDVELGPRHLAVWESMLRRLRTRGARLRPSMPTGGPTEAAAPGEARLVRDIAAVGPDNLTLASLPVSQLGAGRDELYSLHSEASTEMLERALRAPDLQADAILVQVLNGNGIPGVGAEVAKRLVGKGYRIALSGNASRLDYRRTLIVAYDHSARADRSAARVRRLLGAGEVRVAAQPQGIVDLTIVVGKDFSQR